MIAVVVVLSLCVWAGAASTSLQGCESCHFKDGAFKSATQATAHSEVPCAACHVQASRLLPRAKFTFYELFGMRLRLVDPSSTDIALVKDERCLSCHSVVMSKTTASGGLRIKHSSCGLGQDCVHCHSEVGHGSATRWSTVSSMNECVACHKAQRATLTCKACHEGRIENKPFTGAEFTVTHGPNWRKTHGMGQMSVCSVCHASESCSRCHGPGVPHTGRIVREHPIFAKRADAKCTMCHGQAFCSGCHQMQMPHPSTFARGHSKLVKAEGQQKCVRCHAQTDCDGCHLRHVHPGGAVGNIPAPFRGGQ